MTGKEWLKELKAGDPVFVSGMIRTLCVVEKITPKGFIKVHSVLYDPYTGRQRGDSGCYCTYLTEATPEDINAYKQGLVIRNALEKMHRALSVTYEQALLITNILGGEQA